MSKLEELLLGRKIDWVESEDDENDRNFRHVFRFSGVIIHVGDNFTIAQAGDGTRKWFSLYDAAQWLDQEPDIMAIRYAISRQYGALAKAARLADRTPHDIYALIDPRDNIIRYIGISINVELRYSQHIHRSGTNKRKNAWIQNLQEQGLQPRLVILEHIEGRYYARRREEYWINHYLEQGLPLTNIDILGVDEWYTGEAAS